jgi:4-diphosphocytidyl-2-C-methyl-D-erythritol kinase
LKDIFNIDRGLDIRIIKRIPVGAGLGGGSSNAAVVLQGLNRLWNLRLSQKRLAEIAKKIGCDIPFFVYNSSFAKAIGRGDEIKPLGALRDTKLWHILIVPNITVSTPFIYRKWDKDSGLTMPGFDVKLLTPLESLMEALRNKDLPLIGKFLFNGLEPFTVKYYPKVQNIKEKLNKLGLKTILMSGSGPAVFGIVSSRKEALTLGRKVKGKDASLKVFVTRTI